MKLQYQNGRRITKFEHEMCPLEAAIARYEQAANEHYSVKNTKSTLTELEREEQLKKALRHLNQQREFLKTIDNVQAKLETYREQGMKAVTGTVPEQVDAMQLMENENHHPTKVLEEYMAAEGVPKPTPGHTAHHIVPGKGKLERVTGPTRLHMFFHGVRINDPANGVYLVAKDADTPHWSMPDSRGHKKYHTNEYEQWVASWIQRETDINHIKTRLQLIGKILQENEPKAVYSQMSQ